MSLPNNRKVLVFDFNIVYPILSGYSLLNQVLSDSQSEYVLVFNFKSQLYEILSEQGYKCYIVPYGTRRGVNKIFDYITVLFKALLIAKKESPTLVHANNALAGRLAIPLAKILNVPSLVQIRNTGLPPRTSLILKYATRVLAVSNFVKNSLPYEMKLKTDVVYDGQPFSSNAFSKIKESSRIVIGMSCRMSEQKGVDLFLKLEKALSDLGYIDKVDFIHCGGQPDTSIISSDMLSKSKVKWLGYIDDMNNFWSKVDIGLLTSNDDEAFGRVIIEGVSNGVTFVSSRCGGPEEIIIDKKTGFLFDINSIKQLTDIVIKLIDDGSYRKSISLKAFYDMQKKFSNEAYVLNIINSYKKVDKIASL